MRRLASVLVLVACVLVLTYVLAPAASPTAPRAVTARDIAAFDQSMPVQTEVNSEVERLRSRLAAPPKAPVPSRNPFRFGVRVAPAPARPAIAPPPAIVEVAPPPVPALPKLVAVTSQLVNGVAVRSVLLGVGDDVVIAKPGDTVMKLVLREVTSDAAAFLDPATGIIYRIK